MNRLLRPWLAIIAIIALQGCSWLRTELNDPEITLVGFSRAASDGLLLQRFALRLHITNPNDLQLDIKGMTFTFEVGGRELLHGISNDIPLIEPYGEAEFTVQGSARLLEALQLLRDTHRNGSDTMDYTLYTRIELAKGWPSTFNLKRTGSIDMAGER